MSQHYRACPASRAVLTVFGEPQECDCEEIERDRHEQEREAWLEVGRDNGF